MSIERVAGGLLIILALVVAIVPQFSNCSHQGSFMTVSGMAGKPMDDSKPISPGDMMGGTTATTMTMGTTPTTAMGESAAGGTGAMAPMKVPMKCYYTARASIASAIPLALVGLFLLLSRRKETTRALAVLGVALGAVTMALPFLVGTCASASAICNEEMKPTLLLAGGLTIVISLVALVASKRRVEAEV